MFSENLRRRRLEMGMSQGELAQAAGYRSRSSIAKLESGISDITQSRLRVIAAVLNTTPEDLIGGEKKTEEPANRERHLKSDSAEHVAVLIQAGGKSTRNMLSIPSQFVNVDDKPIIAYVMEAYENHPLIDVIDVVCLYGWENTVASYARKYNITKLGRIMTGGFSIMDSVRIGFNGRKNSLNDEDVIILQEATRPMISVGLISKILSAYNEFGNSVFVHPMNEYVQIEIEERASSLCNRGSLFSIESPEVYSVKELQSGLEQQRKRGIDDGACCAVMMHRLGIPMHYCESTANNIKIIRQEDIYIFKVLNQVIL